jgi:hypothetical protein
MFSKFCALLFHSIQWQSRAGVDESGCDTTQCSIHSFSSRNVGQLHKSPSHDRRDSNPVPLECKYTVSRLANQYEVDILRKYYKNLSKRFAILFVSSSVERHCLLGAEFGGNWQGHEGKQQQLG